MKQKTLVTKRTTGIGFENAYRVFEDEFALTREDYIDENGEMRYQTIGIVAGVLISQGASVPPIVRSTCATSIKADKYEETQYFRRR